MQTNYKKITFLVIIGVAVVLAGAVAINYLKYNSSSFLTASLLNQPTPIVNQSSANFAILAGSGITFAGSGNTVTGDIGSSPTNSITGSFTLNGTNHGNDATAQAAKTDLGIAYDNASQTATTALTELAGTKTAGVYSSDSGTFGLTGTLTLNAQGDPNAIFIFRTTTTLTTAGASQIVLANGAQACNVFWQVGTSATLGASSSFKGNILASESASLGTTVDVKGSVLARTGAVTLAGSDTITNTPCAPSLLLQKAVSAGSLDDLSVWTLTATGIGDSPTNLSGKTGTTGANSDLQFSDATFKVDTYTLAEIPATTANYATTYRCVNVNNGVTTTTTSSLITLVADDKATCTITNTYTAPVATPVNGTCGTAATSYLYNATTFSGTMCGVGSGVTTPASPVFPTVGNSVTWTCGGSNGGDNSSTCTATRAATPTSTITVNKLVVGGPKGISDFPLFVGSTAVNSGETNSFSVPASYTVTETSGSNYTTTFSGDCSNGIVSLALGVPKVCNITNTYLSSGGGNSYTSNVSVVPPLIDVVKVPSPLALPAGPGPVTYTYTLRNIGTVPMTNITMVGDTCSPIALISGDTNVDSKLDVNETWVYHCSTTLSQTHTNTVTATGWANGISATDIASATVVVGMPIVPPLIHVTKVPSPLALPAGGGMVTYTKKVTNPGTVALSNVQISDDKCVPVNYISGDANSDSKLDPVETWTYTCQTNLTKTTTNTVTVSGQANGLTARDFAIATVVVAVPNLPNTGFAPK